MVSGVGKRRKLKKERGKKKRGEGEKESRVWVGGYVCVGEVCLWRDILPAAQGGGGVVGVVWRRRWGGVT